MPHPAVSSILQGDTSAILGSPFQCLATLAVKKFLLRMKMLKQDLNVRVQLDLELHGYNSQFTAISLSMFRNTKISWHLSAGMDNDGGNLFHVELRYFSPNMSVCPGSVVGWFLAKARYFGAKHVPWGTPGLSPHCYFSVTLFPINLSLKPIFYF